MRLARAAKNPESYQLGPRVLEQGEELPLLLPARLTPSKATDCLHVVALSAEGVQFLLNVPSSDDTANDITLVSRAGLIELVNCGEPDASFADLSIGMLSPRGVVALVSYIDQKPAASAMKWLPARAAGKEATQRMLEHRAGLGSLNERLKRLERRASFQGADRTEQKSISPQDLESGELLIGFDPGCHEVQLVIEADRTRLDVLDLNPELVWVDTGELAARNLSSSPSPTFRVCSAVARIARFAFDVSPSYRKAMLFRAHFPWPAGIPSNWATRARDQMALALFRRHLPSLLSLPSQSWIGNSSSTSLLVSVTPRSCYLALVATSHGSINDVSLSVASESRLVADTSLDDVGASAAFCISQATSVKIDVDARGADVVWILGVWAVSSGPLHSDFS